MNIPLNVIITVLVAHFIADWLCQSREVADNKSKDNLVLLMHCIIYGMGIYFITGFFNAIFKYTSEDIIFLWAIINTVAHFMTDYVTSRLTSAMYKEQRYREFFLIIGFDQLIHGVWLFTSYAALTKYFV
jgi:membrane protein insertase Oxa1/YidC/SpoIIIJ